MNERFDHDQLLSIFNRRASLFRCGLVVGVPNQIGNAAPYLIDLAPVPRIP
jgi:hypothetical protein